MPQITPVNRRKILAMLGGIYLLFSGVKRWETAVVIGTIAFHIGLTNLGGDGDRRHLVPIEPLLWTLLLAGLSTGIAVWVKSKWMKFNWERF